MIADIVLTRSVQTVAQTWRQEAELRRTRWQQDPVAPALESCASELESELARVQREARPLTVAEYARAHGAAAATVRRWIAAGELEASKDAAGDWRIPRGARRQRRARARTLRRAAQAGG